MSEAVCLCLRVLQFFLRELKALQQNPHSWRNILFLLLCFLSYGLEGLEGPSRNKVPTGIARKVIEARKAPSPREFRGSLNAGRGQAT
jgi:hypothetical protein